MKLSALNRICKLLTHIVLPADLLSGDAQQMLRSRFIKEYEDILLIETYVVVWSDYV